LRELVTSMCVVVCLVNQLRPGSLRSYTHIHRPTTTSTFKYINPHRSLSSNER